MTLLKFEWKINNIAAFTVYELPPLSHDCRFEKRLVHKKRKQKERVKGGLLALWPDGHQEGPDSCVCVCVCACVCVGEQ